MQIPVLVEAVAGRGYVAKAGPPFGWSAEGATAAEAVDKLRAAATAFVAAGGQVTAIDVPGTATNGAVAAPPAENPWLKWAGTWDPNDPMVQEWLDAIQEYRRQIDNDPNVY